jgi:hypothetical protein
MLLTTRDEYESSGVSQLAAADPSRNLQLVSDLECFHLTDTEGQP